jgi:multidrug efflux pump subunit AcrA (membrane-fusion protein)
MKKINQYLRTIYSLVIQKSKRFYAWYIIQSKRRKISIAAAALLVLFGLIKLLTGGDNATAETKDTNRKVIVSRISDISGSGKDFPLVGTVTSVSEATIRAESSGKLVYVSKKLGDMVYAGGVIAEFENSAEKAAVLQAEGAYEQAKAARLIASLNSGQAGTSLVDSKNLALNSIMSAYTTIEDSVRGKTDGAFIDPKFDQVRLVISVPDANLSSSLEANRKKIEKMLLAREIKNKSINLACTIDEVREVIQQEFSSGRLSVEELKKISGGTCGGFTCY